MTFAVNVCGVVCDGVGNSEVDEFELTADNDEICRLQIGVDNLFFVDDMDSLQHLTQQFSVSFRNRFLRK